MAATAILLELSIFLLITAAASATTAKTPDPVSTLCFKGNGGEQQEVAVAVQIKKSLIQDLIAKVPVRRETYYCNELGLDGLKMNGYAECPGRDRNGDVSRRACTDCLARVGNALIDSCGDTGAGLAHDGNSVCYFSVGYSLEVCPNGTY